MDQKRNQGLIDRRRRIVATLRLRGMTQREIVDALAKQVFTNPVTGESYRFVDPAKGTPYSLATVNRDLQALSREWQSEAAKDIAEHKANMLAEIEEVKRAAWGAKDLVVILKALKQISDLLGLDAPKRQEITGKDGKDLFDIDDLHRAQQGLKQWEDEQKPDNPD